MTVQEIRVVCRRGRVITVAIASFVFFFNTAQTGIPRTVMAQLVFDSTASCISEGYDHIVQLSLNYVVDTNLWQRMQIATLPLFLASTFDESSLPSFFKPFLALL